MENCFICCELVNSCIQNKFVYLFGLFIAWIIGFSIGFDIFIQVDSEVYHRYGHMGNQTEF